MISADFNRSFEKIGICNSPQTKLHYNICNTFITFNNIITFNNNCDS